jgi:hypothetical protein
LRTQPSAAKSGRPFIVRAATRMAPAIVGLACLGAAALPAQAAEPWGFEQVTPVDKGAGAVAPVDTFQTSPDGDSFLLTATGSFAGVPSESQPMYVRYLASRGAGAWGHRPIDPSSNPIPPANVAVVMQTVAESADVSHALVVSTRDLAPGATDGGGNIYVRNTATGAYTLVATSDNPRLAQQFTFHTAQFNAHYVASDGRSALFSSELPLVPGAPTTDPISPRVIYSWTAEEGVRVASVLPETEGGAIVGAVGAVGTGEDGTRNFIPDSGGIDHVYFRPSGGPIYVRSGDETRVVSTSRLSGGSGDPVGATPVATSRGGRYLLFVTDDATRLTDDTPAPFNAQTRLLYRYDLVEDDLTYIGDPGQSFNQPNWVDQMSQDGQTVVFRSRLVLAEGATDTWDENLGWSQEENLYVWRDGTLRFVATADRDSKATRNSDNLRVLSSNGRYYAFTDNSTGPNSAAARSGVDLGAPNPGCRRDLGGGSSEAVVCQQVFLFDADANGGVGELECASCRSDGLPPTGTAADPGNDLPGYIRNGRQAQTVADDGTTFFSSPDGLVAGDANGLNDVYAYRNGEQRLLSRATAGASARFLDSTPDGKTVFFATNDAIVPTDTDKSIDVYMTREGAGFPYTPPVVVPPCVGGECRDPFAAGGLLPAPIGSLTFAAPGDEPDWTRGATVRVSKLRAVIGSRAVLRVRVPSAGRIRVSGRAVRNVGKPTTRATTYRVRVALKARGRKALAKRKALKIRVRVAFRARDGKTARRMVTVKFKAPKAGRRASAGGR